MVSLFLINMAAVGFEPTERGRLPSLRALRLAAISHSATQPGATGREVVNSLLDTHIIPNC